MESFSLRVGKTLWVMRICKYSLVFGLWSLALVLCLVMAKAKDQKPKTYSIDILSAAAVAHGAKIKESTVNEPSK
jgi:hypothetical protein